MIASRLTPTSPEQPHDEREDAERQIQLVARCPVSPN